ncbi:hypothetical protein ACFQ0K_10035 [Nocardioides caeni]|uniref:Uncharacterized protein n=1 Tax=Nocardioides caeni TaxID=574700 RepID=A0A4S8N6E5_9ACTN|nr:hypothetical protein [Nocardioides caeni]THV11191.1 hypothetical protein E9934_12930 [Nocardioides caeni]
MTGRLRTAVGAVATLISVVLGGCGSTDEGTRSAADDVPALRAALGEIDAVMVERDHGEARRLLRQLIADVRRAQAAGELDDAVAADIVAAARRLLAELADRTQPSDGAATTPTEGVTDDTSAPSDTHTERASSESTPQPTRQATEEPTATPSDPVSPSSPAPTPEPTPEVPEASKPAASAITASP